ncbi:phosphopantetheine-binding protein [Nocardioides sp. T2.26MG-1]|uniref:phosphopantetheine-binding protein n=1 Tax=Nocardioides sp. T2.26MG-1 TaxID=3041166 RepID=UPI00247739D7|nr:phosphopantetheine-binding protein [Nocardioides sp. T2.26MG-1]CAI9398629.1 Acyl carrier protein [Nocardioides sp. T2.26MG-1]
MDTTQSPDHTDTTFVEVVDAVVTVLGIEERRDSLTTSTGLLGGIPELDSLSLVELVVVLEERFGIAIDDSEFTGEVFDTLGTLAAFVTGKQQLVA